MKTMRNLLTLALATLFCLSFAATSFAGISGTKHDMRLRTGVETQNGEICIYCHSPHVEDIAAVSDYNPLWAADVQTATNFIPYYSATLDAAPIGDPLVGPSRLCMSCHDGTIAIDSALNGSVMVNVGSTDLDPDRFLVGNGATLTSDHPIGFNYVAVGGSGVGAGTGDDLEIKGADTPYAGATIGAFLFDDGTNDIMTCATCHDVHTDATDFFLVTSNINSLLCLGCHDK